MDRKEICAFLIGCEVEDFMAYADKGELGFVVIGPDGRKHKYTNEDISRGKEKLLAQAEAARSEAQAPKPPAKAGTERKQKPKKTLRRKPTSKPKPPGGKE